MTNMPAKTRSFGRQNANVTLSFGNAKCLLSRSKCKEYLELSITITLTYSYVTGYYHKLWIPRTQISAYK